MATEYTPGTWNIDPAHSNIAFTARHMMITKVHGEFKEFSGSVTLDKDPAKSSATASIKTASIFTNQEDRDTHVKSPDFLDVEKYPTIDFRSTAVRPDGDKFEVDGELTVHGVTKPVTLTGELTGVGKDPWGGTRAGFEATTEIKRSDFGMTFNAPLETGGVLVSDKIGITLDVQVVLAS